MPHLHHFHWTPVEALILGVLLTFAFQAVLQLLVVPRAEARKRREQRFEDRLADVQALLTAQEENIRSAKTADKVLESRWGPNWTALPMPRDPSFAAVNARWESSMGQIKEGMESL